MQRGELERAAAFYEQVLAIQPRNFQANANLGNILLRRGEMEQAIARYRVALKGEPDNAMLYCNLGMALAALARYREATDQYRKALRLQPGAVEVHLLMGNAFLATGEVEKALAEFRAATRIEPGHAEALAAQAGALERLGRHEEAHDIINGLLKNGKPTTGTAVAYAAIARHVGEESRACEVVTEVLSEPGLTNMQRLELHFAAGRLLDTLKQYEAAFAHYDKGNALAPRNHDPEADDRFFDRIMTCFPEPAFAAARQSGGSSSDRPVFVLGMPRSGTSLVEQIIATHPQAHGAGELRTLQTLANGICGAHSPGGSAYPCHVSNLTPETTGTTARQYLEQIDRLDCNATRVVDKMPHNFLFIGLIALLFPHARIIHCTRHPLDTCLSIYFQYFGGSNAYAYDLASLGRHYSNYARLMAHWKSLGIDMLDVSYEALVADQAAVSREIIEYCGLDWDPCCLAFHQSPRLTRTASYDQVRKPVYSHAVGRWKHYEKHLRPLITQFKKTGLM